MSEQLADRTATPEPAPVDAVASRRALPLRPPSSLGVYGLGLLTALVLGGVVLRSIGTDPFAAYSEMLSASLGSTRALGETLQQTTPLLLGGAAVAAAMQVGMINLGVDGQIYAGAAAATGLALLMDERYAAPLTIAVLLTAGALLGAATAAVPAMLRVRLGVSELFTSVMFNFLVLYFVTWLASGPWTDPLAGAALTRPIPAQDRLPDLVRHVGIGIGIAVLVVVVSHLWLTRTKKGFECRAVGANSLAARYGGVAVAWTGAGAMVFGGAFAGLAGAIEVLGVHQRLIIGLSPNFGLTSVLIAVLTRRNTLALIPVAFAFAVLAVGADDLERSIQLPSSATVLFQGLVVLCILLFDAAFRRRSPWTSA
jgi:ABC-type uncharacterized transport system permease subunit